MKNEENNKFNNKNEITIDEARDIHSWEYNCPKCKSTNIVYGDRISVFDGAGEWKLLYYRCLDCGFRYDLDGEGEGK